MPAGSTYTPIATYTAGSAQSSITFSSLGSYTDIRIVANMMDSNQYGLLRLNSDSGANYSRTWMYGNGTSALSNRTTGDTSMYWGATASGSLYLLNEFNIMNYSNSATNKTVLVRQVEPGSGGITGAFVYLWRNTSAITSISFLSAGGGGGSNTIQAGTSVTLYGIKAA